jgi:hypothetical protein
LNRHRHIREHLRGNLSFARPMEPRATGLGGAEGPQEVDNGPRRDRRTAHDSARSCAGRFGLCFRSEYETFASCLPCASDAAGRRLAMKPIIVIAIVSAMSATSAVAANRVGGAPIAQTKMSAPAHATGQPNQSCGSASAPNTPGNASAAPGSAFNPSGHAGTVYAGQQPQNSRNGASVSQYDVACFHQR